MHEKVGFIGVGNMGAPMSRRLLEVGYRLTAFDLRTEPLEKVASFGAAKAGSVRELASGSDVVITMLPDSTAVQAVVFGDDGLAKHLGPKQAFIDMGTSLPRSTRAIGRQLADKGVAMLDAPVSGGVAGAERGSLAVMVGGDAAIFERWRPLFEAVGSSVFHVGGIGTGHTMKAVNNFLSATTMVATSEAVVLAKKAGISAQTAIAVINSGSGRSYSSEYKFPSFVLNEAFNAGFTIGQLHKDLDILAQVARDHATPALLASTVQHIFQLAMGQGWRDKDHTAMARYLEESSGL